MFLPAPHLYWFRQVELELFVQLLFARLISGDEVKRRRQTSELFALICAQKELFDDATHVHLRLQPTPDCPSLVMLDPATPPLPLMRRGGNAPSAAMVPMIHPHTLHGHGERSAIRVHRSQRAPTKPVRSTALFARGREDVSRIPPAHKVIPTGANGNIGITAPSWMEAGKWAPLRLISIPRRVPLPTGAT